MHGERHDDAEGHRAGKAATVVADQHWHALASQVSCYRSQIGHVTGWSVPSRNRLAFPFLICKRGIPASRERVWQLMGPSRLAGARCAIP